MSLNQYKMRRPQVRVGDKVFINVPAYSRAMKKHAEEGKAYWYSKSFVRDRGTWTQKEWNKSYDENLKDAAKLESFGVSKLPVTITGGSFCHSCAPSNKHVRLPNGKQIHIDREFLVK